MEFWKILNWKALLIQWDYLECNCGNYILQNDAYFEMELGSGCQFLCFDFASYSLSVDYLKYINHSKQYIMVFLIYLDFDVCIHQIFDGIPWMTFDWFIVEHVYLLNEFDFVHFSRILVKHRAQAMVDYYVISIYFWFFITNPELSLYFVFKGFAFFSIAEIKLKLP